MIREAADQIGLKAPPAAPRPWTLAETTVRPRPRGSPSATALQGRSVGLACTLEAHIGLDGASGSELIELDERPLGLHRARVDVPSITRLAIKK